MSNYENSQDFAVKDSELYPNRLICVIRLKATGFKHGVWGTGCMIDEKYVLTAGHTFTTLFKFKRENPKTELSGYVKQALHKGQAIGQYRIKL